MDSYEMALVPAGKAIFGSREDDAQAYDDEKPQFEAEIPPFFIGLFCVTNVQYAAFLTAAGTPASDLEKWILLDGDCHMVKRGADYGVDDEERYGDHPVVNVSWYGAEAYCQWAGLRLPTDLEWEKAARGPEGLVYPWGNEWDPSMCRHRANKGSERTCRVWEYPEGVSRYGLYNISGNVWEWLADWYEEAAYQRHAAGDLTPPASGGSKVLRGGSWNEDKPTGLRAAFRYYSAPFGRSADYGFRCARDA
jgi:formylglycine-generating enzyme required for sulfatase activity